MPTGLSYKPFRIFSFFPNTFSNRLRFSLFTPSLYVRFEYHIDFGYFGIEFISFLDERDNRLDDIPKIFNFVSGFVFFKLRVLKSTWSGFEHIFKTVTRARKMSRCSDYTNKILGYCKRKLLLNI